MTDKSLIPDTKPLCLVFSGAAFLFYDLFFLLFRKIGPETREFYGYIFMSVVCFLMITYTFMFEKRRHDMYESIYRDFRSLFTVIVSSMVIMLSCCIFPEFTEPVLLCSVIGAIMFEPYIGISISLCFSLIYSVISAADTLLILYMCFMSLIGAMIASGLKSDTKVRLYKYCITIVAVCTGLGVLMYYLKNGCFDYLFFTYSLSSAFCQCLLLLIFIRLYNKFVLGEESRKIDKVTDKNFELQKLMREFDRDYYNHCLYVSRVCSFMAKETGADERIAECTGLYYHIGDYDGGDELKIALEYKFPAKVIHNLYEIGAVYKKPSTRESFIAYITDNVFGELDKNRREGRPIGDYEIFMHQYTNELSRSGVMDESGTSMNQFIKLREILVKVGKEYDSKF